MRVVKSVMTARAREGEWLVSMVRIVRMSDAPVDIVELDHDLLLLPLRHLHRLSLQVADLYVYVGKEQNYDGVRTAVMVYVYAIATVIVYMI